MCMEKFWKNRRETVNSNCPWGGGLGIWGGGLGIWGRRETYFSLKYERCIYYLPFKNHVSGTTFSNKILFFKV